MTWAIILIVCFAGLHFGLQLAAGPAILLALVATAALWILWKAKWVIAVFLGLEWLFSEGD